MQQITIKGQGHASKRPDQIQLVLALSTHLEAYDETLEKAANDVSLLQTAIVSSGLNQEALKTTDFTINAHYTSERDQDQNYIQKFDGYLCTQQLAVVFDFDLKRLSKTLDEIAKSQTAPRLSIHFTLKDKTDFVNQALLSANENAKKRALLLAEANSMKLGRLVSIDYSWPENDLYSPTRVNLLEDSSPRMMRASINVEPEDITIHDHVTFVWELV